MLAYREYLTKWKHILIGHNNESVEVNNGNTGVFLLNDKDMTPEQKSRTLALIADAPKLLEKLTRVMELPIVYLQLSDDETKQIHELLTKHNS